MKHLFLVLTLGNCFSGARGQKGKKSWALEEFRAKPAEKKLNHLHLMALINHRYDFYFSLLSSCPYSHPFPSCRVEHLHKPERKWKPSGDALNCLSFFSIYKYVCVCVCVCVCNVHVNFCLHSSLLLWLKLTPLCSSGLPSMCFSFTLAYQHVCVYEYIIYTVWIYISSYKTKHNKQKYTFLNSTAILSSAVPYSFIPCSVRQYLLGSVVCRDLD